MQKTGIMYKRIVLYFSSLLFAVLTITSCRHSVNSVGHPSFNKDGILSSEVSDAFFSGKQASKIGLYVEASGSMNGLYRPNKPSAFKRCMSAILLDYGSEIKNVYTFTDGNANTKTYSVTEFRNSMNAGGLVSARSTEVPTMLERVINDVNSNVCDVALFVSDMKYSPSGNGATAMDQYALSVAQLFKSHSNLVVSVIGLESEYFSPNGRIATGDFPYYIIIVGDKEHASYMRTMLLQTLDKAPNCGACVKGCIDFNAVYGCPVYSVLPTSGATSLHQNMNELLPGDRFYSFTGYLPDNDLAKGEFILAIRYQHIPYPVLKQLGDDSFSISSYTNGATVSCSLINSQPSLSNMYDKDVVEYVHPSTFLKITIDSMLFVPDVLNITLNEPVPDTSWITKYYGATRESDLEHTLSIDKFISGLRSAYPQTANYQDAPMMVLISDID